MVIGSLSNEDGQQPRPCMFIKWMSLFVVCGSFCFSFAFSMTLLPPQVLWRQIVLLTRGPCLAFVKAQGPQGEFPHHIGALKLFFFKVIVDAFNYRIIQTWLYSLCYCAHKSMVSVSWYLLVLPQSRFQVNWAGWFENTADHWGARGWGQQWNVEVQCSQMFVGGGLGLISVQKVKSSWWILSASG